MNNFNINPNFSFNGFDNSINDFNKILNSAKETADKNLEDLSKFSEVMENVAFQNDQAAKFEKTVTPPFLGLDAINAQKLENYSVSPTAKMASDIGSGLKEGLENLNQVDKKAQDDLETFASGGDISVHDVMISAQKSQLAMQMALQLRNQVMNAYQEFKNMSV